jgi:hypothetical protein
MELSYRLTLDDCRKFDKLAIARVTSQASVWKQVAGALPVSLILLPKMAALVLLIESGLIDRRAAGAVGVAYVWGIASRVTRIGWRPASSAPSGQGRVGC